MNEVGKFGGGAGRVFKPSTVGKWYVGPDSGGTRTERANWRKRNLSKRQFEFCRRQVRDRAEGPGEGKRGSTKAWGDQVWGKGMFPTQNRPA